MSELAKRLATYKTRVSHHGAEAMAAIERRWTPIAQELDSLAAAKARILGSISLSQVGKDEALAALTAGDGAALAAKLRTIKEAIRKEYAELLGDENAAQIALVKNEGGGYTRDPDARRLERTTENILLEQELRAELKAMKRHEVQELYQQAVLNDDDPLLVSAIESCPSRRLALVSDEVLDRVREVRIAKSPMAQRIARQRDEYDTNTLLCEMAGAELYAAVPGVRDDAAPLPKRRAVMVPFSVEQQRATA